MNGAVDPSYPLLPMATFVSALMLLLVMLTNIVRQSWNLGVTFLCFWLFVEHVTDGTNFIIWSDNADVKLWIYCDIVSRIQYITFVVKPMATLIITRRLHLIVSLQSVDLPDKAAVRWLFIPLLVAGPLCETVAVSYPTALELTSADYINQIARFEVLEGFGCTNGLDGSILYYLTIQSWTVIPPLLSVLIYYPKVARIFYRQSRDINRFLHSNGSVSRTNYLRILALASIDILLTLPVGIVNIALSVSSNLAQGGFSFYPGWDVVHGDWTPIVYTYAELKAFGPSTLAEYYFAYWASPALAFTIFGLFGLTAEARASYWCIICAVCSRLGWDLTTREQDARSTSGTIDFAVQPRATLSFQAIIRSYPSLVGTDLAHNGIEAQREGTTTSGGIGEARVDAPDKVSSDPEQCAVL
ncbi:hypothetical protein PENSPDRAFT_643237 [Peniophora sp. CONT]|nr:hypothetical protein PENSPDRAFT_643237 [Peniophora sp. CONT]